MSEATTEQRPPRTELRRVMGPKLLLVGVVLWALTWMWNRGVRAQHTGFRDIEHLGE